MTLLCMPLPTILLLFLLLGMYFMKRLEFWISFVRLRIWCEIFLNVNFGTKGPQPVLIRLTSISSRFASSLSFSVLPLILGFPMNILSKNMMLPLPYRVAYRLFVALVSSCYNHFALSCDIRPAQSNSLKHAILVPKRSRWVCREALYSVHCYLHNYSWTTDILSNIFYMLRKLLPPQRYHLAHLWHATLHLRWGPCCRLRNAAKHFGFLFEDPFVLQLHDMAYSVDEPLDYLKHLIRDSYRQHYLSQASKWRKDCQGKMMNIDVPITRSLYLSRTNPLHQSILRSVLTGSIDHAQRLLKSKKSKLTTDPFCPLLSHSRGNS